MRLNPTLIYAGVAFAAFYTVSLASAMEPSGKGDPVPLQAIRQSTEILDDDGQVLCRVKPGTAMTATSRHANGEDLKVKLSSPGCPSEAFVDQDAIKPSADKELIVNESNLALRSKPTTESRFQCGVLENEAVEVIENTSTSWVKVRVKNSKPGCEEGFMNADYLKTAKNFSELPVAQETIQPTKDLRSKTEAGVDCPDGPECKKKDPTKDLGDVVENLGQENLFYDGINRLLKNSKAKVPGLKTARGLLQIPLCSKSGFVGPYGSFHYEPTSPGPVGADAYANPTAGCAFMGSLQKWNQEKSKICPATSDCRVAWGDISYAKSKRWPGRRPAHRTHAHGDCVDIRPMLKGKFQNAPLTYKSAAYDREATAKFVGFLREQGASVVIFNDRKINARRLKGHNNHIHVCFGKNAKSKNACAKIDKNEKICPAVTK